MQINWRKKGVKMITVENLDPDMEFPAQHTAGSMDTTHAVNPSAGRGGR
jgi:hypothetical protein